VDLQTAKARLEQLLAELDSSTSTLSSENAGVDTELSHFDQHPADTASEIDDANREAAILAMAGDQRSQVLAALARIEDGTYGRCIDCGQPLPDERLEARPEAARCVADQQKFEGAR
jgi:RNA polymerase-binding transcription factor DksA